MKYFTSYKRTDIECVLIFSYAVHCSTSAYYNTSNRTDKNPDFDTKYILGSNVCEFYFGFPSLFAVCNRSQDVLYLKGQSVMHLLLFSLVEDIFIIFNSACCLVNYNVNKAALNASDVSVG